MYSFPSDIIALWLVLASLASGGILNSNSLPASQVLEERAVCGITCALRPAPFAIRRLFANNLILVASGTPVSCVSGYQCCTVAYVAACIPNNSVCCDNGSWIGWCPTGARCGVLNGSPACINQNGKTVTASAPAEVVTRTQSTVVTTTPTAAPTATSCKHDHRAMNITGLEVQLNADAYISWPGAASSSSSDVGGLSKGATIGIAVSVTCSVLSLILGLAIRYHFSRKAARKGEI